MGGDDLELELELELELALGPGTVSFSMEGISKRKKVSPKSTQTISTHRNK